VDINALPAGEAALVDANIIIYYLGGVSADCRDFFHRVARREVEAHITTTIIAETLHRRMMAEAVAKGLISPGQIVKKLKANPAVIQRLTDHMAEVERLLRLPFRIHQIMRSDIITSHALRQAHGLFVNDSINLACAQRLTLTSVVTHDSDFNRVPTLSVWEPTDI
jgi:predicted nucleic acid-binding protein